MAMALLCSSCVNSEYIAELFSLPYYQGNIEEIPDPAVVGCMAVEPIVDGVKSVLLLKPEVCIRLHEEPDCSDQPGYVISESKPVMPSTWYSRSVGPC